MPSYKVLRPIEHNNVLYVPSGFEAPEKLPSAAHGGLVPVNASGVIELSEREAAEFVLGQIPLLDGKPDSLEAAKKREAEAAKKKK